MLLLQLGRDRKQNWTVSSAYTSIVASVVLTIINTLIKMIVYFGFSVWAISCGCISTLNPTKPKVAHVIFTILAGFGAGQVQSFF